MMQIGGKAYGLPQDTGLTYFYNAKEFEKLGITVPKTADELIATAKKTAAQGKYIMTFQPDEGHDDDVRHFRRFRRVVQD